MDPAVKAAGRRDGGLFTGKDIAEVRGEDKKNWRLRCCCLFANIKLTDHRLTRQKIAGSTALRIYKKHNPKSQFSPRALYGLSTKPCFLIMGLQ